MMHWTAPFAITGALVASAGSVAAIDAPTARRASVNGEDTSTWSPPVTLSACSLPGGPYVAFPGDSPFHGSGSGAIVFEGASGCPSAKAPAGARVSSIGAADLPQAPRPLRDASGRALELDSLDAVAATSVGQIALVGAPPATTYTRSSGLVIEGLAAGPFTATALGGTVEPLALSTAYLGDVAIVSRADPTTAHTAIRRRGLQLRMQRHYASSFAAPVPLGGGQAPRGPLALALSYRTDAFIVWWQAGYLYARERRASGTLDPIQRIARASSQTQLAALASDDGHAILAWDDPRAGTLYLDVSGAAMRLGSPRLVERFASPAATDQSPGSDVKLVRLSNESVLMAWTGSEDGRLVVRAAGIDLGGVRTESTISPPDTSARLLALATGPQGDAFALWSAHPAGQNATRTSLFAARGVPSTRGAPSFGPPEQVAPTGSYMSANLAVDPDSDSALAAWRESNGRVLYSLRRGP